MSGDIPRARKLLRRALRLVRTIPDSHGPQRYIKNALNLMRNRSRKASKR